MKSIFTFFLLATSLLLHGQVPTWSETFRQKKTQRKYHFQQIAAYQATLEYLKKGYEIVDKGLTLIGDIQNGTLNLDKDYFNSLKQVSPVIRKSPKVNEILNYQKSIDDAFKQLTVYCKNNEHIADTEREYVNRVHKGMLQNGKDAIDELTTITTSGEAEMKDDERLSRLSGIHEEMQQQYAFTKDFASNIKLIAIQRAKEKHELESMRKTQSKG